MREIDSYLHHSEFRFKKNKQKNRANEIRLRHINR